MCQQGMLRVSYTESYNRHVKHAVVDKCMFKTQSLSALSSFILQPSGKP